MTDEMQKLADVCDRAAYALEYLGGDMLNDERDRDNADGAAMRVLADEIRAGLFVRVEAPHD